MVNRTMQAKLLKIKQSKRKAYLTRPRSGGVDAGKIVSHEIFQNRNRVNTTSGKSSEALPILNNTWLEQLPKDLRLRVQDMDTDKLYRKMNAFLIQDPKTKEWFRTPKAAIEARKIIDQIEIEHAKDEGSMLLGALRQVWQGIRRQGVTTFNVITLESKDKFSIKLYFSGQDVRLVQETEDKRWISRQYTSHADAMQAYKSRYISWIRQEEKKESS